MMLNHWNRKSVLLAGALALSGGCAAADDLDEQQVLITASRLGDGLVGASTSIITAETIAADPAPDLPAILAREAGVQLQSLFGSSVTGAQAAIGLRGFGATATENTLILVNGRRLNDPDQSNIDFSALPIGSIDRIEITRGNSAAVLYGDGATGGVINIITKTGDKAPAGSSVDTAVGSDQYRSITLGSNQTFGGTSVSIYASDIVSNGYRDNNALRERAGTADLRQDIDQGSLYVTVRGEDQHLGLPGAIDPSLWVATPKATQTPNDYGDLQSVDAALGGTRRLNDALELVVDAGVRHKEEQSNYLASASFFGSNVTTLSFTPRLNINTHLADLGSKTITGVDVYQSYYRSFQAVTEGDVPYQNNLLQQLTLALYGEESLTVGPSTQIGVGLRLQQADLHARQKIDVAAPGYYGEAAGTPLRQTDNEYAAHLGVEQAITQEISLFARLGHAMRLPNMDDRNYVVVSPTNFILRTQTSNDVELGARLAWGPVSAQSSVYAMNLEHEIDYDPGANDGAGANVNLDPTRRIGSDTEFAWQVASGLRLTATGSVTQATFRAGPYKGQEVPQVALLSGNQGIAWDLWQRFLTASVDLREIGKRRLGDDFTGQFPKIPATNTLDLKLGGEVAMLHWSASVLNLFDVRSYDLGYAGSSPGTSSVYPLPGRTFMGRLGANF